MKKAVIFSSSSVLYKFTLNSQKGQANTILFFFVTLNIILKYEMNYSIHFIDW